MFVGGRYIDKFTDLFVKATIQSQGGTQQGKLCTLLCLLGLLEIGCEQVLEGPIPIVSGRSYTPLELASLNMA